MPIYMGIFDKPDVLSKQLRGQVKAKGYEGWIELQSAQLGQSRQVPAPSGRGTNRQASAPTVHEIVASKLMDSVSTALFKASIEGEGKLVIIAFVKDDGSSYMKLVLQNALIASYTIGSGDQRMETFTLDFTTITFDTAKKSPNTTHSQVYRLSQQSSWDYTPRVGI